MSSVSQRPARVFAMQLLYAMEITKSPVGDCVDGVLDSMEVAPAMKRYGMSLVDLVQEHREELDSIIKERSVGWDLGRIAKLDRIILQIALVELLYEKDIPVKVAMEESVQIANKYSTEDSYRFINGILDLFVKNKGMLSPGESSEEKNK
ncbi:MAG: transcription antitermination factor NusB [Fibrobacteraceae bacterium]|nr:transcription antitermination factor NusB [Fibrobacteraceae bacterium]